MAKPAKVVVARSATGMFVSKRPLTRQDAFDLAPAVKEKAWGLKEHLSVQGSTYSPPRTMAAGLKK